MITVKRLHQTLYELIIVIWFADGFDLAQPDFNFRNWVNIDFQETKLPVMLKSDDLIFSYPMV